MGILKTGTSDYVLLPQIIGTNNQKFSRIIDICVGQENTFFMKDDGIIFATGKMDNDVISVLMQILTLTSNDIYFEGIIHIITPSNFAIPKTPHLNPISVENLDFMLPISKLNKKHNQEFTKQKRLARRSSYVDPKNLKSKLDLSQILK